jgi:hypothetical protein
MNCGKWRGARAFAWDTTWIFTEKKSFFISSNCHELQVTWTVRTSGLTTDIQDTWTQLWTTSRMRWPVRSSAPSTKTLSAGRLPTTPLLISASSLGTIEVYKWPVTSLKCYKNMVASFVFVTLNREIPAIIFLLSKTKY